MRRLTKSVGLTLTPDGYDRLLAFAQDHQWTVAQAARVIIMERLTAGIPPEPAP